MVYYDIVRFVRKIIREKCFVIENCVFLRCFIKPKIKKNKYGNRLVISKYDRQHKRNIIVLACDFEWHILNCRLFCRFDGLSNT